MSVRVTADQSANAAYIRLSDQPVESTEKLNDDVLVDLDNLRVVVGIEVLRMDAPLPFARLRDEFHVHSDVTNLIDSLLPNISYQLERFEQSHEGVSAQGAGRLEQRALAR